MDPISRNVLNHGFQTLRLDGDEVPRSSHEVRTADGDASLFDVEGDSGEASSPGFVSTSTSRKLSSATASRAISPEATPSSCEKVSSTRAPELTSTDRQRSASRVHSAEWALSSGEDFNFEEDFEVQESEIEEGLEAIPTLDFPAKIDEENIVSALSLAVNDVDDNVDADDEQLRVGDGGGGCGGGGEGPDDGRRRYDYGSGGSLGGGVAAVKLVDVVPPKGFARIPLVAAAAADAADQRTHPNSVISTSSTASGVSGTDLPRFFQTTVMPPSNDKTDTDFGSQLAKWNLNQQMVTQKAQELKQQQSQQKQEKPKQNLPQTRSRRVPTLPSLPRPKEKNSLFGDFFGGGGSGGGGGNKKSEASPSSLSSSAMAAEPDTLDKMKTKISSAFNNVKYGWTIKTKTNFKTDSAIWLLGELYHPALDLSASVDKNSNHDDIEETAKASTTKILDMFKSDFTSRIWFTYRREFPVLSGSNLTTDCGWGCMLRSAQMMLAQCFVVHFMGRDWRLFDPQDRTQEAFHRQIIKWFGDSPSDLSPFSVHRLVKVGRTLGKKAGDWYGPSSVAFIAREAMTNAYTFNPILGQIRIYVSKDCTIYIPDVDELCRQKPRQSFSSSCESNSEDRSILPYHLNAKALSQQAKAARRASKLKEAGDNNNEEEEEWTSALLLLIPVRLGGETLNESAYLDCIKSMLALKQSVGIIGGRPKHSLWFVGYQEDRLIHLDPHYCQDVVDFSQRDFPLHTFHCVSPRKMSFSKMDPSCTIGFYLRNKAEFDKFVGYINEILKVQPKGNYPMFVFSSDRAEDVENEALQGLRDLDGDFVVDAISGEKYNSKLSLDSEDDYVLL